MSCHEDRESDGLYIVRVIDAETGDQVAVTWASTRAHCDARLSAMRERYDTPDAYRFEVEEA